MVRTVSEGIREGLLTMSALQSQRQQRQQQEFANTIARAELQSKGMQITPGKQGFMGFGRTADEISQIPGHVDYDKFFNQKKYEAVTDPSGVQLPPGWFINPVTGEPEREKGSGVSVYTGDYDPNAPTGYAEQGDPLITDETVTAEMQEFATPEQADASGLPPGTRVRVSGRPYEI